ncbi:hypothetical protein NDU88_005743 [Pleurodeles waltl]|uniref:Secreted protein n=1 Tax=Pleurodeles waltl TaxID=8319 RepID=A0AAV7MYV8_PLEWA|nr:hypothetical protein NDU88_005743 [Pleurodeles waltl]
MAASWASSSGCICYPASSLAIMLLTVPRIHATHTTTTPGSLPAVAKISQKRQCLGAYHNALQHAVRQRYDLSLWTWHPRVHLLRAPSAWCGLCNINSLPLGAASSSEAGNLLAHCGVWLGITLLIVKSTCF